MTVTLSQFYHLSPSDVEIFAVDFTDTLSTTEILSGPTVTQIGSTILTIASVSVNSSAVEILGRSVIASKAVIFKVSGQLTNGSTSFTGSLYRARVTTTTSSVPARTLVRDVTFDCV